MKALLVICEGRHDINFVQRSLGVAGCRWSEEPIGHLPSPFGSVPGRSRKGLIATRIEREVGGLTLRSAAYPPLPQFESAIFDDANETMFVLIRANGKQQVDAITDMLADVDDALDIGPVDVTEYAVAFLFDANSDGVTGTLQAFHDRYQQHFGSAATVGHAQWLHATACHIGVFVVHRSLADPFGTLEDHLVPMVEASWHQQYKGACDFVDGNKQAGDAVYGNDANRLKAVITATGQFQHPGAPLSTVVGRGGLPRVQFEQCKLSQDLTRFLQAVPWNQDDGRAGSMGSGD